MKLEKGRPNIIEGRLEKEVRVYDFLDQLGISYERVDHQPLMTMDDCDEVDAVLNAAICKNLFLRNGKKDRYYLLMLLGDKKFKSGEISRQIQSSRLSFASPEDMETFLDIKPGAVSVMGLMNDHDHRVQLLVDEELLNHEYLGCHPCVNTSSLRLRLKDVLEKFLKATEHEPVYVKINKDM